jgi:dolichol kinase
MPPPTQADIVGLLASYAYAFALLLLVEGLGRALKWPAFTTRKLIHIGAGMWVWGILALFEQWQYGVIPFATFILLNYAFYRLKVFRQMDGESETLGTVYFAVSITILFLAFWPADRVAIAAAATMIMTWGDALAALIGRYYGKREYTTFGHTRTLEGSIVFVVAAFVAAGLTLGLVPGSNLAPTHATMTPSAALLLSVGGVAVGAAAEAASPRGLDNLTVPLGAGLIMGLLSTLVM